MMDRIWDFSAFGSNTALIDDTGITVRYDELEALQDQLSGICPGELTMMMCENSIGALSGYAALLNGGHPMLMVSAGIPRDMRRDIMNTYRPGMVYAPQSLCGDYPNMTKLRTVDNYVLLRTNYTEHWPIHPALGQLMTTSGSTGSVKFVRQSRENIRINAQLSADFQGMTEADRTITTLPLNYTYGLAIFGASLIKGATMIVTRAGAMDEEFWDLFEKEHVTAFHGVPTTYDMLHRMDLFSEDFPSLKLMTQAGAKLSQDQQQYFAQYAADYGKRFIIVYGQTEATGAISFLPAEKAGEKLGSIGIAVPGGELELIDDEGKTVEAPHVPGELVYRGKNVALGYATRGEDLAGGDDWHGEIRTGDIAEKDEDGYLFIAGRKKRYIKMMGHRISLDEIDERIMNAINVRSVSSGTDDHLVIFVLSEDEQKAVRDFVRSQISVLRPAFRVAVIERFPVNEAGKILYGELQKTAERLIDSDK